MSTDNDAYPQVVVRPERQVLRCVGCREEILISLAWAVITQDHAEFGLDCVSVFCSSRCLLELVKREEHATMTSNGWWERCEECGGSGWVEPEE